MKPIDLLQLIDFPMGLLSAVAWNDITRVTVSVDGSSQSVSLTVEAYRLSEMRFYKRHREGWVKI